MSNSRKQPSKGTGLISSVGTSSGAQTSSHQNHKNLRRHLDMGLPTYGGADSTSGSNNQGNLFEIKKRSIDFFQQVRLPKLHNFINRAKKTRALKHTHQYLVALMQILLVSYLYPF